MKFSVASNAWLLTLATGLFWSDFSRAGTYAVDAVSREFSVFNSGPPSSALNGVESISREFSVFNSGPSSSAVNGIESISREFSVFNYGSNLLHLAVGSAVVQAGNSGSVPVTVSTIVPLSNIVLSVDFPPNLLSNWMVLGQGPYTGSVMVSNNSRLYLTFNHAISGQTIQGSNQVLGQVQFASASNQPSAFLPLPVAGVTPTLIYANAFAPSRTFTGDGEVAVVGSNSLVRLYRGTNHQFYLKLYGLNGTNYGLESATNLIPPITWQPAFAGQQFSPGTNLIALSPDLILTNKMLFYRARQ